MTYIAPCDVFVCDENYCDESPATKWFATNLFVTKSPTFTGIIRYVCTLLPVYILYSSVMFVVSSTDVIDVMPLPGLYYLSPKKTS